ncbi:MAG: DNA mismatch repair endonuclease MutL [Clostridiales bacterium]|nr:DNA mismatch repair endonuclease MutL [Clostridiales bacterium]
MSKINILDKSVYNKIAAGEVVEKPASVVKELVENSIDAGAKNITIEILSGGIDKISVSDDGCGIERDDFEKVFLPHATSKVKNIDDLSQIGTLGFRGEALSSIASVSKVTLSSKTENDIGYQTRCEGGELDEIKPIGATQGTYIIIENLFYNIPARKKFLRKPKIEENDITNYIARLILANPDISFKYLADNKVVYQSFGTGLYDAIYTIYGKSIVDNIFEFEFKNGDFSFNGYLGKPVFSKPNRTYQTLLINGRYVINQSISTAVYKAYENFMMKGNYPFYVINLNIPLDKVDVNVHPNKLDVKFEDSNQIFGIVYSHISEILYGINNTKTISVEEEIQEVDASKLNKYISSGSTYVSSNNSSSDDYKYPTSKSLNAKIEEVSLNDDSEYESNKLDKEIKHFENEVKESGEKLIPIFTPSTLDFKIAQPKNNVIQEVNLDENIEQTSIKQNVIQEEIVELENISKTKIIGTIFNTYVLIENDNELILIDQHAGHERILFDKFNLELESSQVAIQPLLIPHILETNNIEANHINNNLDLLKELGFEIENFGTNSYRISTVPVLFDNININEFFDNILKDIDNKLVLSRQETLKEYIAKTACKTAVKGKDKLSENEIEILVKKLNEPGQVLLCPHGRPIAIKVTKTEIEKWFKRIV